MKFKITLIALILSVSFINAQTKVGTVNSDLIIGKMPQMKQVLKRVDNYAKKLDSTFKIKFKGYQEKIDAYKKTQSTSTLDQNKKKYNEILALEQEMQKFKENGAKMMQFRRDELIRPLYKKAGEVITAIAKEKGYSQILTTSGNQFAYIDLEHDITKLVLEKLGIKE